MCQLEKPGDSITLTRDIFITDYSDIQDDKPFDVIILNTPLYGVLSYDNNIIGSNFVFNIDDVSKLKYIRVSNLEYTENITFKTSDNNINKLYSNMATFTINVNEYINLPPDQIGDNEITIDYGETRVFTVSDFTTNTTPAYQDPEGDAPLKLKVLSLPDNGLLKLDSVNVTINQEILFTDISSGLFTFVPDNTITTSDTVDFDFDIADAGSGEYSGL